ncbi:MAG: hypothetical protein ACRC2R_07705 [Xenococcaceae cyanobacterium]
MSSLSFLLLIVLIGVSLAIYFISAAPTSTRKNRNLSWLEKFQQGYQYRKEEIQCAPLRRELLKRVNAETADRLIRGEKIKHPDRSESWYLEKVIYDLKRGR